MCLCFKDLLTLHFQNLQQTLIGKKGGRERQKKGAHKEYHLKTYA